MKRATSNRQHRPNVAPQAASDDLNALLEEYTSKLEQKVATESQHFRLMADAMPQIVWTALPDGTVDFVNKKWFEFTGLGKSESLRLFQSGALLHPSDAARSQRLWEKSLATGQQFEMEYRFKNRGTGEYRWFLARALPGRSSDGKILKWFGTSTDITDRKLNEQHLSESESRFRLLADTAPVLIWMAGTNKLCTYFNLPWLNYTGRSLAATIGEGWKKDIHPDDLELCDRVYNKAFDERRPYRMEYRIRRHDGVYRWFLDQGTPRFSQNREFLGYIGTCTDITDRKEYEEKLTVRSHLQQAISYLGQRALSENDITRLMQRATKQLVDILKVDFVKILELQPDGKHLVLRSGAGWKKDIAVNQQTVDAGRNSQAGYTLSVKHAVIVEDLANESRFSGPPLLTRHGVRSGMSVILYRKYRKPYGVLGVHSKTKRKFGQDDIEYLQSVANILSLAIQRQQTEEELAESQNRMKLAVSAGEIGTYTWDIESDTVLADDEFARLYGIDAARAQTGITSKEFWQSIHPEDRRQIRALMEKNLAERNQDYSSEFRVINKHGEEHWVVSRGMIVYSPRGKAIKAAGAVVDITELKKLEHQKDEFLGIASHELKTPVTSLKMYAQLMERRFEKEGNDEALENMRRINAQLDRLIVLMNDLLDVTKIESGKLRFNLTEFAFDDLAREIVATLQLTTSTHKIMLRGKCNHKIRADRDRVGQVFINLINNAVKYSPDKDKVNVKVLCRNGRVEVSVQDFGIGISKREQEHVFERFFRANDAATGSSSGLGLGLYISSQIIQRLGGRIWVESKKHAGSTFHFTLPLRTD